MIVVVLSSSQKFLFYANFKSVEIVGVSAPLDRNIISANIQELGMFICIR
jgi:hypothetical protein